MKLKYYLRGLGTGIAVTALIIGISSFASRKEVMTDEEVIARAKELGMVERTVLSETVTEVEENDEESEPEGQMPVESEVKVEEEAEIVPEETAPEENAPEEIVAEEVVPDETLPEAVPDEIVPEETVTGESGEESDAIEFNSEETKFGMPDEAGTIQFTIVRGDSSDSVSRRLEEMGLVDSAVDYDRYLCQNGYDKRIQTGNYEIPANATQEEIAIMITSR